MDANQTNEAERAAEYVSTLLSNEELTYINQSSPTEDCLRSLVFDLPEEAITQQTESEGATNGSAIEQFIDSISVEDRQLMIGAAAHCVRRRKSRGSSN